MFSTYLRLRVRTAASDIAVVRAARLKIARHHRSSRAMREERHTFYRKMLEYHHNCQELAAAYRLYS